jgi:hypothetical protein
MVQRGICIDILFVFCAGNSGLHSQNARRIMHQDELAMSISKWSSSATDSIALNEWQEEAMDNALHKSFQLIQGPPGRSLLDTTL